MSGGFSHLRETFAAQFEKDGDGYIYRYSQKGPAIRVTATEREQFAKQFNRSIWLMTGVTVAAMLLWTGALAFFLIQESEPPESLMYLGLAGVIAVGLPVTYWGWRAPVRALRARTPVAQAMANEEFQRRHLATLTYGQLGMGAVFGLAIPFLGSSNFDVLTGWGRIWLLFGAALVVTCAVQAFRKWRFERTSRPNR